MPKTKHSPEDFELKKENKKDFNKSTIVRKNIESEFTLENINEHLEYLEKQLKELEAQLGVCKAARENVAHFYPKIAKMEDKELHAAATYHENYQVEKDCAIKIGQAKAKIKEYNQISDLVHGKFGFVKSDKV
jgi:chromosome segregation ATPase